MRCKLCGDSFKRTIPHQNWCSVTCSKAAGSEEYLQVRRELDLRLQNALARGLARGDGQSGSGGV